MADLVSIIMPTYNNAEYICASVNSVLNQSYENWELIIIDDCSNDGTEDILNDFTDTRIRYYKNELNYGAAISRNRALQIARGRWIAFLDSDDLWHPEKIEKQLRFMKENDFAVSCCGYAVIDRDGKLASYSITAPSAIDYRVLHRYCYPGALTVMYDFEVIGLLQIEDLKKNNDYALWLLAVKKAEMHYLDDCLALYRKHGGSISSGNKVKLIKHHYRLFRKSQKYGAAYSLLCTFRNLFFGVLKKIKYRRPLSDKEKDCFQSILKVDTY